MSRLYNTFEFIGQISLPREDKFHQVNTSVGGWEGHRLNFAVKESKTNSVFVELYGGFNKAKPNTVFSLGKGTESVNGTKLEIPWEDRLKDETLDMIADFKKIVVDYTTDPDQKEKNNKLHYEIRTLEYKDSKTEAELDKLNELRKQYKEQSTSRYEFAHEYDAVVFLSQTLEGYKNHKFKLTGNIDYQFYNGRFYRKFKPTLIEIAPDDEPNKLRATMDVFFTKDALDDRDFKKDKKIYVDGYVLSYDSDYKADKFFPQQLVLNAQKVDFENEQHVNLFNFLKNKFDVKGKGVYHLQWEVKIFRGAEQIEFTEADLTQAQKEAIAFGANTLDDFKPKGGLLGENVEENRLSKPVLVKVNESNDFRDGAIESSFDVEDLTYVPFAKDDVKKTVATTDTKEESKQPPVDINKELDDLF